MKYTEVKGDLFSVGKNYVLAQCIASDCRMGAGIAIQFVKKNPKMREILQMMQAKIGDVIFYNGEGNHRVFNLITKDTSWNKPTRDDFNRSIINLKNEMVSRDFHHLAMPLIGSGLDRLDWEESKEFVMKEFADTDIEIMVFKL